MKPFTPVALLALCVFLSACAPTDADPGTTDVALDPSSPASAYCLAQGGTLEHIANKDGDLGMCHLPDGRIVEEWTLFHASQKPVALIEEKHPPATEQGPIVHPIQVEPLSEHERSTALQAEIERLEALLFEAETEAERLKQPATTLAP